MSDLDTPKTTKGLLQSTFVKIVVMVVSLAITGAIGYFFASVKSDLSKISSIDTRLTIIETIQKSELVKNIDALKEVIKEHSTQFGTVNNDIKRIEILIARIEKDVIALEKHR
jgi:hypothetical protein